MKRNLYVYALSSIVKYMLVCLAGVLAAQVFLPTLIIRIASEDVANPIKFQRQNVDSVLWIYVIVLFIWGIVAYREQLRLTLQMGYSRRTSWLVNAAACLSVIPVVSLLILPTGLLVKKLTPQVQVHDLFSFLYPGLHPAAKLLLTALILAVAYFLGLTINLIYANLKTPGIIGFTVGTIACINLLFLFNVTSRPTIQYLTWIGASPVRLMLSTAVVLVILSGTSYLFNRRLPLLKGV